MKKYLLALLILPTLLTAQTVGFNYGQMFSFVNEQYGALDSLPSEVVDLIKANVPGEYLQNARFSGTMSNYMNLHEKGYGTHIEQFSQWQILTNRLPAKECDCRGCGENCVKTNAINRFVRERRKHT